LTFRHPMLVLRHEPHNRKSKCLDNVRFPGSARQGNDVQTFTCGDTKAKMLHNVARFTHEAMQHVAIQRLPGLPCDAYPDACPAVCAPQSISLATDPVRAAAGAVTGQSNIVKA